MLNPSPWLVSESPRPRPHTPPARCDWPTGGVVRRTGPGGHVAEWLCLFASKHTGTREGVALQPTVRPAAAAQRHYTGQTVSQHLSLHYYCYCKAVVQSSVFDDYSHSFFCRVWLIIQNTVASNKDTCSFWVWGAEDVHLPSWFDVSQMSFTANVMCRFIIFMHRGSKTWAS